MEYYLKQTLLLLSVLLYQTAATYLTVRHR